MDHRHFEWDPRDVLGHLARESTLMAAWSDVLANAADDGHIGRAVRAFEAVALSRLKQLQEELSSMTYAPGRVTEAPVEINGKKRVLRLSTVRDRVVERALQDTLAPIIDPTLTPFSFGYRRGLGVKDAIAQLAQLRDEGATHVLRCDIHAAFDEIPRGRAVDALRERVPDERIGELVARLLARLDDEALGGRGIAQGSSLSPLLLNVYLDPVDRAMLAAGYRILRFADDIAIPTNSEADALAALDVLNDVLATLDLALNDSKTMIEDFDHGVTFLGTTLHAHGGMSTQLERPKRMSLFVAEGGAIVRVRKGSVRVDRDQETIAAVSLSRVHQVVVQGRVGLTTPFLHEAARRGVDVVLLSDSGGYLGRLHRRRGLDPRIKRAQFTAAADPERALAIARSFVSGKIANLRVAVLRGSRTGERSAKEAEVADSLARLRDYAGEAVTHATLMGLEGTAARQYFAWMRGRVGDRWGFEARERRPPRDPVNAMLSYGYTILSTELISAAEQAGLDPDIGFLHSDRWGRPSLALDLMEEWRPVIVDSVVLRMIATEQVQPEDFTYDPVTGCRMTDKARKALLESYERRMLTKVSSGDAGVREAYRRLLVGQARRLAEHLEFPEAPYASYLWR